MTKTTVALAAAVVLGVAAPASAGKCPKASTSFHEADASVCVHKRKDVRHGPFSIDHSNNKVFVEGTWRNGKRHGTWTWYTSDGDVLGTSKYKNGTGSHMSFYQNGQIRNIGAYRKGKRHGRWLMYSKRGWLQAIVTYKSGKAATIRMYRGSDKAVSDPVEAKKYLTLLAKTERSVAGDGYIAPPVGIEGGVEGGVIGGVLGGVVGGVAPPPPPPPPKGPKIVPSKMLMDNLISGDKNIVPPQGAKDAMKRDGQSRTVAVFKMCVARSGSVDSLKLIKSSGYGEYDKKLRREMNSWKFEPIEVNGKAVPVCTAMTFIYKATE